MPPELIRWIAEFLIIAAAIGAAFWRLNTHHKVRVAQLDAEREQIQKDREAFAHEAAELERSRKEIASITPEDADKKVLDAAEKRTRSTINQMVSEATAEAKERSAAILVASMGRIAAATAAESAALIIQLPNEEMKGRLIGREGRNIKAFEQVTGVDLLIDETPESVTISSFDPLRRETARLTLLNLMLDGRIHPGRIEEIYEKAKEELNIAALELGQEAAIKAQVNDLSPPILKQMGLLRFRTSVAQNVLDHSIETAQLCTMISAELGLDPNHAKTAGFLHDIGKSLPPEYGDTHALAGMKFLIENGLPLEVTKAVGAHHHEIEPDSLVAQIVIIADTLSAARPGARRESTDNFIKRMAELEKIADRFDGVEKSYAIQSGREIRVVVNSSHVDDSNAVELANQIAEKIQSDIKYPGQIKVTVIREFRTQSIAK
ncbi:MAG: ribonuclease Y [Armatimonadetes bacterium]|nr:ribonuclease Y [Armatimonadota bacterium]